MNLSRILIASAAALFLCLPASAKSIEGLPDGIFDEWEGAKLGRSDPLGDGPAGGLDLGRLWLGDDGEALYLRLEVGRETILQNPPSGDIGNDLRLYLDFDRKKSTGLPVGNLGAELEIRFGLHSVFRYDQAGNPESVAPGAGIAMAFPTHSSDEFEIRIELPESLRTARTGTFKAKRKRIKLILRDHVEGGDRLPDGGSINYKLAKKAVADPTPIRFDRAQAADVRILSMNVEASTPAIRPDVYRRLLEAIRPDIVAFQELTAWNAEQAREFVESVLSPDGEIAWEARQQFDTITVSAFPILAWAPIDGNLVTLIDLPEERDLVLFNMHPPCCNNEDGRDEEFDNLAAAWRDLLQGSFSFSIRDGDAAVFAGDYNLVGYRRQLESIRDGVFVDASRGANFKPGRGEGSLRDPPLRHTHRRLAYTWRRASSSFSPGRLDLILFTGDALALEKGFVVDTGSMRSKTRKKLGLNRRDSELASDHLGLVVDFSVRDAN